MLIFLESIYFSLWRVVSFICVWHHISRYIFNFTYQNNLNLNKIIEAWCCSLPSIPTNSVLLCWTTLTDFIFFILNWEMLFLSINSLDLYDMEAPVCLVFLKHIIQILNYLYLMVLFLLKIRPCWQIVFQFEFFPPFVWEYDKIGIDCITFIWNSSLAMMCLIMFQSILFVPWLVHDEHSLCISIINLISWCAVHPLRY